MTKKKRPFFPIVCFESSLTEGKGEAEYDKWPTRLQVLFEAESAEKFRVYNRGVSGNTTALALDRMDSDVLPLMPGWVIIGFGGNDSTIRPNRKTPRVSVGEFENNLNEMCQMIQKTGGRPILLNYHLPVPDLCPLPVRQYVQGNGKTHAQNLRPYHAAARRVSLTKKVPIIEVPRLLKKNSIRAEDIVATDGIHLTPHGNHFYAQQIFMMLVKIIRP